MLLKWQSHRKSNESVALHRLPPKMAKFKGVVRFTETVTRLMIMIILKYKDSTETCSK